MDKSYVSLLVNWLVIEVTAIRLYTNSYITFISIISRRKRIELSDHKP